MERSKYKFSHAQRFAVWRAFDGQCYWCAEPLLFAESTIDHVLPEDLEGDPENRDRIFATLGLSPGFGINTFRNWVAAHWRCNLRKGNLVVADAPIMAITLKRISSWADESEKIYESVRADKNKGRILGRLLAGLTEGVVSREDVELLLAGLPPPHAIGPSTEREPVLQLAPQWQLVRTEGNLAILSREGVVGHTWAGPNPHHSWICPHCGERGPWNGIRCLSCGQMSDPND